MCVLPSPSYPRVAVRRTGLERHAKHKVTIKTKKTVYKKLISAIVFEPFEAGFVLRQRKHAKSSELNPAKKKTHICATKQFSMGVGVLSSIGRRTPLTWVVLKGLYE